MGNHEHRKDLDSSTEQERLRDMGTNPTQMIIAEAHGMYSSADQK